MNLAEAYSLFMHGLNLQLRQLVGTMVTSGNMKEVIEIVKKVTVYNTDKGGSSQGKLKTNKKDRVEVKMVSREARAIGALVVDQKERSKSLQETPRRKSLPVL